MRRRLRQCDGCRRSNQNQPGMVELKSATFFRLSRSAVFWQGTVVTGKPATRFLVVGLLLHWTQIVYKFTLHERRSNTAKYQSRSVAPSNFRRMAFYTTRDEQMKAHGHQDRAYENNVRPTRHRVGCVDESPFPRGMPKNGQRQKREKSSAPTGYQHCRVRDSESYPRLLCGAK